MQGRVGQGRAGWEEGPGSGFNQAREQVGGMNQGWRPGHPALGRGRNLSGPEFPSLEAICNMLHSYHTDRSGSACLRPKVTPGVVLNLGSFCEMSPKGLTPNNCELKRLTRTR